MARGPDRTIRQSMFTMGEVDEITWKRSDFKDYLTAAQSLLNAEVGTTGLCRKRKGTKFLLNVIPYAETNSKIYEFSDKDGNFYLVLSANLAFHIFTIVGDALTFYQTVVSPYTSADLLNLDYTEDNDTLIFSIGNTIPSRIFVDSYGPVVFAFEALNIFPFPAFDFGTIDYDGFTVSLSGNSTTITFQFTGLGSDPGFTTDWIGGQIIGGGQTPDDPLGYAIISNVTPFSAGTVTFTGDVRIPFKIAGASTKGSEYSIRQPSWSSTLGFPKKISFYQNRLWFGNSASLQNTVFASQINKPVNFDVGVARDTDAIIYAIGQTNTGGITWLNPGKQLEIYTKNFEFVAPQDVNTALTPSTFTIRLQDAYGASETMKPVNYTNDSYYTSKTGNAFINFKFDGIGQAYVSSNISIASSHLIKQPKNRALLRGTDSSQDNFVYMLNNDETITAFQFAIPVGLGAFTPVEFQTDDNGDPTIEVLDIFTIDNEVYMLKFYTLNSIYAIEKFVEDVKMDSYIDSTMDVAGLVTGLDELNGYEVTVVFDGQDFGQYTVVGGQIDVFNPNLVSGPVQVGLLYPFQMRTMYIYDGATKSSWFKKFTEINVDYFQSLVLFINGTLVPYQTFQDVQQQLPPVPQTGTAEIYSVRGWNKFSTIEITQNAPFDVQILSIDYRIHASIVS